MAGTEAEIRQLQQEWVSAMEEADTEALARLLHPGGSYVHSTGRVDPFPAQLEDIRAGRIRYEATSFEVDSVIAIDDAAFVSGQLRARVLRPGAEPRDIHPLAGVAWFRIEGRWQVVAIRLTRLDAG